MDLHRDHEAKAEAEAAARRSYGKLVAFLAARSGDVAGAEDALAEAFAAALQQWPVGGPPANPEAWLLTVARRKIIDAHRRRKLGESALPHLQIAAEVLPDDTDMLIPDRRLALMFACAHPAIDPAIRTPLILQTVLGLDAASIASAFLVSPSTMGQRLVRAKTKIREAGIPLRVPAPDDLGERVEAVLDAIYAAYTEGWAAMDGADSSRRNLAREAIFLGRLLAELMPREAEALGLAALMLFAESRRAARRDASGRYVPLSEQDTRLWDRHMMAEAEDLLRRASQEHRIGRFQLEAAVQSVHAGRALSGKTDWLAIVALYDGLRRLTGSSAATINRAIAVAETAGPQAGLAALAEAEAGGGFEQYQPYWAARAVLLARAGDLAGAEAAFSQAIGLATDPAVRDFLQERKQALHG